MAKFVTLTNMFRVSDEAEYRNLFENLPIAGEDDTILDCSVERDGSVLHGFRIEECPFIRMDRNTDEELCVFLERMQPLLPEGEKLVMVSMETGQTHFCESFSCSVTSVTKDGIVHMDRESFENAALRFVESFLGTGSVEKN